MSNVSVAASAGEETISSGKQNTALFKLQSGPDVPPSSSPSRLGSAGSQPFPHPMTRSARRSAPSH